MQQRGGLPRPRPCTRSSRPTTPSGSYGGSRARGQMERVGRQPSYGAADGTTKAKRRPRLGHILEAIAPVYSLALWCHGQKVSSKTTNRAFAAAIPINRATLGHTGATWGERKNMATSPLDPQPPPMSPIIGKRGTESRRESRWEERDGVTERESLVRRGERRRRLHEWGMGGVLGWVYVAAVLGRGGRAYDEDGRQIRSDDRLCPDNLGRSDCA